MKGESLEINISRLLHSQHTPMLISSLFLRRKNLGQIDLAILCPSNLKIYEVKSSNVGIKRLYKGDQIYRLRASAQYLSRTLSLKVELKIIAKR